MNGLQGINMVSGVEDPYTPVFNKEGMNQRRVVEVYHYL